MNIYEWMRKVSNAALDYADNLEALDMITGLERAGAFGTIARQTEGTHRYTRASSRPNAPCGLCDKPESEHES